MIKSLNFIQILIFFIIIYFHMFFIDNLEKQFFSKILPSNITRRPLDACNYKSIDNLFCNGFPSNNAEVITIICSILYFYKYISLPFGILIVIITSFQRVLTNMHTILQVVMGIFFGLLFSKLYIYSNLSWRCLIHLVVTIILLYSIIKLV